ncbi:carbohydrate kinase family protein [Actinomadura sp. HBU206391]|uniref:carbohydrate kinase family protein n=1 Tax=Actinomadura sp. HBU206391 TaxID=2731692 RepID=UPI00164EE0B1|nr:carbohydrate kinase [Actinomadura sp. HBU206391]MBC6461414.1 carbohydrate kinase [Actinomadura sp. HBU206391]
MNHIAVIGETVADAFVSPDPIPGPLDLHVRPGGGPANTAVALSRLGVPTRFVGRIPHGPLGALLRTYLSESGVDLRHVADAPESATLALAAVGDDGQAIYSFYTEGTADWQWTTDELAARTPLGASCVHAGSLALALEPGGPLIENLLRAHRPTSTISIDPNVRPGIIPLDKYRRLLPGWIATADLFRLSEDDLTLLCPDRTIDDLCEEWHTAGIQLIIITRGERGAHASLNGHRITTRSRSITPVDTIGAGDAFTAGLLHTLHYHGALGRRLHTLDPDLLEHALAFATEVATLTCLRQGADPPRLTDMSTIRTW